MTEAAYWIWGITLAIVAFVIVPVAWSLLNQALSRTKSICEYSDDMLQSGLGIAQNTSHTKQLGTTLEHATAIVMDKNSRTRSFRAFIPLLYRRREGETV